MTIFVFESTDVDPLFGEILAWKDRNISEEQSPDDNPGSQKIY